MSVSAGVPQPKTRRERMAQRMAPRKERVEAFLKTFEWTWTIAIIASVGVTFFLLISMAVIPSFFMYFAEQTLQWEGPASIESLFTEFGQGGWKPVVRDAIAMGLSTGPLITLLVVGAVMQNWRRKLRGQSDARPTGGYR
jgi:hypothetical protein